MRNKDQSHPKFPAQRTNEFKNFTLHYNVQCRCRLVHDDQLWCEGQGNGNNCALTHAATQFMRIAANAIWGDTDQAQQFDSTLSSRICSHRWPMRTQHICDLSTDIEYGIERIHSTLENNSQFAPTKGTQLRSCKLKNIHRLRNITW